VRKGLLEQQQIPAPRVLLVLLVLLGREVLLDLTGRRRTPVSQVGGSNTVQALAVTTAIVGPGIPSIIVGIKQIG